jgi:hypothetical protein
MKRIVAVLIATLILSSSGTGSCESGLSYDATVTKIKGLMPSISSSIRREAYGYITFDNCLLGYSVSGFYPVGTPYRKIFSNIDLSSLDPKESKTGADMSSYVILYFNKPFDLVEDSVKRTSKTVVIDAADNGEAEALFRLFLHLGELCKGEPRRNIGGIQGHHTN